MQIARLKVRFRSLYQKVKMFFRDRNLATFCLFLLFATILWFGHSMNSVRERAVDIPIEYIGIPDNVVFNEALPTSIRIVVRDQGRRLREYKKANFSPIQFDLSAQLKSAAGQVTIYSEQIRQRITDQLKGTTKLQRIEPETIVRDFHKEKHKKVKVIFTGQLQPAVQYQITSKAVVKPEQVMIYAPKEILDTIRYVYTEKQVFHNVKDSFCAEVPLIVPKGCRVGCPNVQVSAFAGQYTEKSFTVPIVPKGVPKDVHLRTFPAVANVVVKVEMVHFNDVSESDVEVHCSFPQSESVLLPIEVVTKNSYILGYRVSPQEVEYIIEH